MDRGGKFGLAVCVRLCDGFFFPSSSPSGGDQACAAQCPDARTALYREAVGSDRIEDAVSSSGALYSSLSTAGLHRTASNSACTCHRSDVNYSAMLLHDSTLRKGDVVMTPNGPVVYKGGPKSTPRRTDFVAIARDTLLNRDLRVTLSQLRSAAWEPMLEARVSAR